MADDSTWLHLSGRLTDLAPGLQVRRLLPAAARRAVGPFVFFDHFGPATLGPEVNSDVGVHPHIGLATVTYLFDGRQVHRDSLGTVQTIEPGAVNWMTAGRGIAHSERVHPDDRGRTRPAHGLQLWVALPPDQEAGAPAFQHVGAEAIPVHRAEGVQARVLVGTAWGLQSPVRPASPTLYLDIQLAPLARLSLPPCPPGLACERALYGVDQPWTLDGQAVEPATLVVLPDAPAGAAVPAAHAMAPAAPLQLAAGPQGARLVLVGGAPLVRPVRMWWNFVASDRARLAEAARLWAAGGLAEIPGETDRVPAPPWRD